MQIIQPINSSAVPSGATLVGSIGCNDILQSVSAGGNVIFGSPQDSWAGAWNNWLSDIVQTVKDTASYLGEQCASFFQKNEIRSLTSNEELVNIPQCMQLPIMMDPRMRQMLEDNRIHGFGYKPAMLPEEDYIGRMIENGTARDIQPGDPIWLKYHFKSTDPDLNSDRLDDIEDTRSYIWDEFMQVDAKEPVEVDPTNPEQFQLHVSERDIMDHR